MEKEDLVSFFIHTLAGMLNYPGITKAHLYEPFMHNYYEGEFVAGFTNFLRNIQQQLKKTSPEKSDEELKIEVVQIMSAVLMPGFLPGMFEEFLGFEFKDRNKQNNYLNQLLEKYLKDK